MKKTVLTLSIAGALTIGSAIPIQENPFMSQSQAQQQSIIETRNITENNDYIEIEAKLPVIKDIKDKQYAEKINTRIESSFTKHKQQLEQDAKQFAKDAEAEGFPFRKFGLFVEYDVKTKGDIVSIVMTTANYSGGANLNSWVDSINFRNTKPAKPVELTDFASRDQIEKQAKQAVLKQLEDPFGLESLADNQAFYVEGNELVLIFDEYEVAPGVAGTPSVQLSLDKLSGEANDYRTLSQDGVKMVELRKLAEQSGYDVKWDQQSRSVQLDNGSKQIMLQAGEGNGEYKLEAAPLLKDNQMYIPVSFAKQVLNASL